MKIIFITQDGIELPTARVRGYSFARKLREFGLETEVLSLRDDLKAPYFADPAFSDFKKLILGFKLFWHLIDQKEALFYVQKVDYHSLFVYIVALIKGNKIILDIDDWEDKRKVFFWLKVQTLTVFLSKRAWKCIASSQFLFTYLKDFNFNTYLIETVVDEKLFFPEPKNSNENKDKVVFSWAGIVIGKRMYDNLVFVIECFNELTKAEKNVSLEIVGEGPLMPHIKKVIDEQYKEVSIEFKGCIEPDKMSAYYDTVEVGLLPLIQKTKFIFAKSPTKMFEYMAKEIPVVASKVGEPALILSHGENGFLASDKEEFVDCMRRLATDVNLRKQIGKQARKLIEEKYCLTVAGEKLRTIVESRC